MIFDSIQNAHLYENLSPNLKVAFDYMRQNDLAAMEPGRYSLADGAVVVIIKKGVETKGTEQGKWESHREFLDIQYLLDGREKIGFCKADCMEAKTSYDPESDKILYHNSDQAYLTRMFPGDFIVLFPNDAHMTLISDGEVTHNNKAVIKVKL